MKLTHLHKLFALSSARSPARAAISGSSASVSVWASDFTA